MKKEFIMKKFLSLLIAFSLTFVFSVNAFATNVPKDKENISSENVYSAKASTAGGSDSGYFHGDGHLYINMRETNRAVDVYVQVVSSTKEDMNQTYYVAWNTPSGKSYVLSAVKGDGSKNYFNLHVAEQGTHEFYIYRWDGSNDKFTAGAFIKSRN